MSWIGLRKFADIIFGITQKLVYIIPSDLFRYYVTDKFTKMRKGSGTSI